MVASMLLNRTIRPAAYVCRQCAHALRRERRIPNAITSGTSRVRNPQIQHRYITVAANSSVDTSKSPPATAKSNDRFWENQWTIFSASNEALVRKAQEFGNKIITSKTIPSEEETLNALQIIDSASKQLVYDAKTALEKSAESGERREGGSSTNAAAASPASVLLALDGKQSDANPMSISISADLLSKLAYKIVTFPPVFLNPKILQAYVSIQSALHRPSTLPEVFFLYSHKETPIPDSADPIKYRQPNPNAASQAIPEEVAQTALDSAIQAKDLNLALDIIEMAYANSAFHRAKFVRKALPPLTGLSVVPAVAYMVGSQLSQEVSIVDPAQFTTVAVAGILTYVGAITTLGFVAVTSRNDQMERVTWAQGTPLRERWIREEERAAVDRLAMAWGFKQAYKRGDEEGVEWEALREWCGLRGMELDRTDLMEGME